MTLAISNELAEIYALENNWPDALKSYREAEKNVKLGPEEGQADDLARARRGQGYVLVELGRLDEAEKKYRQCLATDPNDTKAKGELGYVREQIAKRKGR